MYLTGVLLSFVILLCSTGVLAQSTTTYSTLVQFCKTTYGPNSPTSVPTRTSTTKETTTYRLTFSATPVKTITPKAITTTRTVRGTDYYGQGTISTVTTEVVSTYTTTITEILIKPTTTETITVPTLYTETTGVVVSVTLNGAPSVSPVIDTLPGATAGSPQKRAPRPEKARSLQRSPRYANLEARQDPAPSYVRRVDCVVISKEAKIVIFDRAAPSTTFTTSGRTATTRYTEPYPSDETIYVPYESITSRTTVTATYTSTRIPTSTYTVYSYTSVQTTTLASISTIYPQCLNQNAAYTVSGLKVQGYEPASPTGLNQITVTGRSISRGSVCCTYCLLDPTCAASFQALMPGGYGCVLISRDNGVCDAANPLLLRALIGPDSDPVGHPSINSVWNNKCGKYVESRQK